MMARARVLAFLVALACIFGVKPAVAAGAHGFPGVGATSTHTTAPPPAVPQPPADLEPAQVDGFVAGLTDAEVRKVLLSTLQGEAEARVAAAEAAAEARAAMQTGGIGGLAQAVQDHYQRLRDRTNVAARHMVDFDHYADSMLRNLTDQEGAPALWRGLAIFVGLLFASWLVGKVFLLAMRRVYRRLDATEPKSFVHRLGLFGTYVTLDGMRLAVVLFTALLLSFAFFERFDPMRVVIITYILVLVSIRAVATVCTRALNGTSCLFPQAQARGREITIWVVVLFSYVAVGIATIDMVLMLGLPEPLARTFQTIEGTIGFFAIGLPMGWALKPRAADAPLSLPTDEETSIDREPQPLGQAWYLFATIYLVATWAVWADRNFLGERSIALLAFGSLILVLVIPAIDSLFRSLLQQVAVAATGGRHLHFSADRWQVGLVAAARLLLTTIALLLLAQALSGGSIVWLNSPAGLAARQAVLQIFVTCLLAYVAWQLVIGWTAKYWDEVDPDVMQSTDGGEGEGGTAQVRSRLGTLVPMLRIAAAIVISVTTVMVLLSAVGLDIGPLLAGAGVIGLAIGFGAQSLVRDIFSGIFFLIDDAFRIGEYIEIDSNLRGEVEKITIRSMQLRHHRGPLITLPFGELRSITNQNRDWAIYKQEFRLPYDTDLETVRKIIKKIGAELLADPVLGPKFLEPLKSQGVIRIEESAMIIRTKFMCKPREQFVLRRVVFQRVQEALHKAGIEFALRRIFVNVAHDADEQEIAAAAGGGAMAAIAASEQETDKPRPAG